MTTSSAIEPETENHQPTKPLMDGKTSSPSFEASSPPANPASASTGRPATPASLYETEFATATGTLTAAVDDIEHLKDHGNGDSSFNTTSTTHPVLGSDSAPTAELSSSTDPRPQSSRGMIDGSIGQSAASYVPNGTHDGTATTSEGDAEGGRRTLHQQRENNEQENVTFTSSTRPTALILEHDTPNVDRDTPSPAPHSLPTPTSISPSVSIEQHMIAEPGMAHRLPKRGSFSPGCSVKSLPRDIAAEYNIHHGPVDSTTAGHEELYGLVDRYGFLVEEGRIPYPGRYIHAQPLLDQQAGQETRHQKMVEKENERAFKWTRMARQYTSKAQETEYSFAHTNSKKFASRVHKGIPDSWRAPAWSYLISLRSNEDGSSIRRTYHKMLGTTSKDEEQIDLDIPRTMHGHIMFRTRYGPGQCALFRVLKAYSNYNTQVGYCQGMANVVATMLTFFDEEKTFVLLVRLFEKYGINNVVKPTFPGLFKAFYIQDELTNIYAPRVFEAMKKMGIETQAYASRWYITLFTGGVVPHRVMLRIWDIFLLEGFDWLYFVAIALLKYHEPILTQGGPDNFERSMELLNAKMDIQDDDRLLKIALQLFRQARRSRIVDKIKNNYVPPPVPTWTPGLSSSSPIVLAPSSNIPPAPGTASAVPASNIAPVPDIASTPSMSSPIMASSFNMGSSIMTSTPNMASPIMASVLSGS
ncbi:MAG: rab-GTPase-TBC domain-containing protein [Benniella sp.]|nr:MAG: rab-GTPase-TBC domain-containing protein [Benniella sp.]